MAREYTQLEQNRLEKINELRAGNHLYVAATLEYDMDHLMSPAVDQRFGQTGAKLE